MEFMANQIRLISIVVVFSVYYTHIFAATIAQPVLIVAQERRRTPWYYYSAGKVYDLLAINVDLCGGCMENSFRFSYNFLGWLKATDTREGEVYDSYEFECAMQNCLIQFKPFKFDMVGY